LHAAERISLPLQRRKAFDFANNQEPTAVFPTRAETEDEKLKKDRMEVLACELPDRNARPTRLNPSGSAVPEFKTSWPRPIPAETLAFCWVTDLMPSTLREIQKPGLPHCSRRFFFYTTKPNRVQGAVYEFGAALGQTGIRLSTKVVAPFATGWGF